jgi:hypothetical protein
MRFVAEAITTALAASALFEAGCSRNAQETPQASRFEAEDARAALVEMVDQSNDDALMYGLPLLKSDPVVVDGPSRIEIGKWRIDLAEKRFVLSLASKRGSYEVSGVFERAPAAKRVARITRKRQT